MLLPSAMAKFFPALTLSVLGTALLSSQAVPGLATSEAESPPRFIAIDVPGALWTFATGVNAKREIVGYLYDASHNLFHGFLLNRLGFTTIDIPGGTATQATGVNDRGDVVGYYTGLDFRGHGFLFSGGKFTPIDFPSH